MKKTNIMQKQSEKNSENVSRKEALKKIGKYGKYTALTALGTYLILNPQKAQAQSPVNAPRNPGLDF
nr:hypothetical protein [Tenacibaculum piscium]